MPKNPNFTFDVRIRISEAFSLESIVRKPRTFKPKEVNSAIKNNELVVKSGNPPDAVVDLARYVVTDFFAHAHGTGLYNRQMQLWEALAKVTQIEGWQLSEGLFQKRQLGVYDLIFQDHKGKALVQAGLFGESDPKISQLKLLKQFIGRARGRAGTGLLVCWTQPVPAEILDWVREHTKTADPIAYYESVLTGTRCNIDLLEMVDAEPAATAEGEPQPPTKAFRLLHPDLRKKVQLAAAN